MKIMVVDESRTSVLDRSINGVYLFLSLRLLHDCVVLLYAGVGCEKKKEGSVFATCGFFSTDVFSGFRPAGFSEEQVEFLFLGELFVYVLLCRDSF